MSGVVSTNKQYLQLRHHGTKILFQLQVVTGACFFIGVMCLDFHPQHPNLLAVGFYDGSVSVFDVRRPTKPLYSSTAATGKHTDPVWEIFWQVRSGNNVGSNTTASGPCVCMCSHLLLSLLCWQ